MKADPKALAWIAAGLLGSHWSLRITLFVSELSEGSYKSDGEDDEWVYAQEFELTDVWGPRSCLFLEQSWGFPFQIHTLPNERIYPLSKAKMLAQGSVYKAEKRFACFLPHFPILSHVQRSECCVRVPSWAWVFIGKKKGKTPRRKK